MAQILSCCMTLALINAESRSSDIASHQPLGSAPMDAGCGSPAAHPVSQKERNPAKKNCMSNPLAVRSSVMSTRTQLASQSTQSSRRQAAAAVKFTLQIREQASELRRNLLEALSCPENGR